jgi:peptide deformylase
MIVGVKYMLVPKDIIDEKNKILRKKSEDVVFPLTDEDKENIRLMVEYLTNSQIDELCGKYGLRPGMGMSAVQIGVLKRYITIVHEYEEGKFNTYIVINPKIVSESKYLPSIRSSVVS